MTMRDLLSVRPPDEHVREASRRARVKALARLNETPKPNTLALLKLTFAAPAVFLLLIALRTPPARPPEPVQPPLRMNMTLTDGTRVIWTFDDNLAL
jgi:hypothetical protein